MPSPWRIDLRVPDEHIGYVLAAQRTADAGIRVSFGLATDPGTTYEGRVTRVALASEITSEWQSTVRVTVRLDREQIPQPRPGATVVAKIHCGQKSVGYVWLHDLIEAIRMRLAL